MKKSWKYGAMRTKFKKFVGYLSNIKQFIRSDSRTANVKTIKCIVFRDKC